MAKTDRKMVRSELIKAVANKTGVDEDLVKSILGETAKLIIANARMGVATHLVGFGNFDLVYRVARKGRNPQTGEKIIIPGHRALHFKAGRNLTQAAHQED